MLTKLLAFALVAATATSAGASANDPAHFAHPVLALPSRADVTAALAKRRAHNLAAFHAYWTGGVYPHNTYRVGPLNVWRDENGHFCAAATMIDKDGQHELAEKTARSNNNLRLLDVTSGPLLDWMLTSGLTIEDIDRIQAPAVEPERVDPQTLAAEDAKLKKGYIATEAFLKKHAAEDLDIATTRLLENPSLAWALVAA
ncbi:MAG TPA: hypothetical protein VFQ65_27550 [Kofleriaceae bacterium]|nr:hypothetical protein [Kofleriaceae bacterium]